MRRPKAATRAEGRRVSWLAVAAGYLLVLQVVFGPWALLRAAAADLPVVVCGHAGEPGPSRPAPHRLPDCCLHGLCGSVHLASPPALATGEAPCGTTGRLFGAGRPGFEDVARPETQPRRTRGPPVPG